MPTVKLTPTNVRTLPAVGGKRTEYRDQVQPALALRVFPSGARSYVIPYTSRSGKDRRFKIGQPDRMTLADAREEARRLRAEIDLGADPQADRNAGRRAPAALTVGQLVDRYLAAANLAPATVKEWRRLAVVEVATIGKSAAAELSRGQIREWARRIADRPAPYVANRAFEVLRAAYAWGVGEDLLHGTPFVKLPRPSQETASARVLPIDELRAVLVGLDRVGGAYGQAAELLLLTLTRRSAVLESGPGELRGLDSEASALWTVPADRTGVKRRRRAREQTPHLVPLSPQAAAIFRARVASIAPGRSRLFPRAGARRHGDAPKGEAATWSSRFVRRWRHEANVERAATILGVSATDKDGRARAEAALKDGTVEPIERWTVHNLRHTAATHMRERLGVGKGLVRLLLGQVRGGDRAASGIYDRAELMVKRRRALRRWANFLDRLRVAVPQTVTTGHFGSGRGQVQ